MLVMAVYSPSNNPVSDKNTDNLHNTKNMTVIISDCSTRVSIFCSQGLPKGPLVMCGQTAFFLSHCI